MTLGFLIRCGCFFRTRHYAQPVALVKFDNAWKTAWQWPKQRRRLKIDWQCVKANLVALDLRGSQRPSRQWCRIHAQLAAPRFCMSVIEFVRFFWNQFCCTLTTRSVENALNNTFNVLVSFTYSKFLIIHYVQCTLEFIKVHHVVVANPRSSAGAPPTIGLGLMWINTRFLFIVTQGFNESTRNIWIDKDNYFINEHQWFGGSTQCFGGST